MNLNNHCLFALLIFIALSVPQANTVSIKLKFQCIPCAITGCLWDFCLNMVGENYTEQVCLSCNLREFPVYQYFTRCEKDNLESSCQSGVCYGPPQSGCTNKLKKYYDFDNKCNISQVNLTCKDCITNKECYQCVSSPGGYEQCVANCYSFSAVKLNLQFCTNDQFNDSCGCCYTVTGATTAQKSEMLQCTSKNSNYKTDALNNYIKTLIPGPVPPEPIADVEVTIFSSLTWVIASILMMIY